MAIHLALLRASSWLCQGVTSGEALESRIWGTRDWIWVFPVQANALPLYSRLLKAVKIKSQHANFLFFFFCLLWFGFAISGAVWLFIAGEDCIFVVLGIVSFNLDAQHMLQLIWLCGFYRSGIIKDFLEYTLFSLMYKLTINYNVKSSPKKPQTTIKCWCKVQWCWTHFIYYVLHKVLSNN